MEINDIPYVDSIVFLEEDMFCVRLSSEDDDACKKTHDIISELFSDTKWIFKMISFAEDLELYLKFCEEKTIRTFKGKTKFRIFTSSYPELHAQIKNLDNLLEAFRNWSSTIYQTQVLYVVSDEKKDGVISALEKDIYRDTDSISSVWPYVEIAIRNQPEAEYHNTFLLFGHKQYFEDIKKCLNYKDKFIS